MNILKSLKNRKTPMRRKLLIYMLALAIIVLVFLACGLFFLGHFVTAKQKAAAALSYQMQTYERQVLKYFEDMTRMGNSLSESVAKKTDEFLAEQGVSFDDLNDDSARIYALEEQLFEKLSTEIMKTDCSGAFVMLGVTVNTSIKDSSSEKAGLYFQRNPFDETDEKLLLYRGSSKIGRKKQVMPHRQWRLEFKTNEFSGYEKFVEKTASFDKTPFLTNIALLPDGSERTMNFIVPVISKNNVVYGLCGFEISESYFKKFFAQVSYFDHLTCLLFPEVKSDFHTLEGFSAGVYGGYYLPPRGDFTVKNLGDGLAFLSPVSKGESFVAKTQQISVCGENRLLVAAYPKEEYDANVANNVVSVVLLLLLLVLATFAVCLFFSRRFLQPLLKGLEQIQKQQHKTAESQFVEIDDLFAFLAEQDRLRDEETAKLRTMCDEQSDSLEQKQAYIDRLAYSRKTEVSPDDYEMFKDGLKSLTKTEKQIFGLYLDGKSADEIMEICRIQKGTLKYHNHNILGKLGVSSRKQMLRYATLLKKENGDNH